MKNFIALTALLFGSQAFSFELQEPVGLHIVLVQSFPAISSTEICYSFFSAETLKCTISETNPKDVDCEAQGSDARTGSPTTTKSHNLRIIEALHKADLSFNNYIELTNLVCQRNDADPSCKEPEFNSCTADSYMSR